MKKGLKDWKVIIILLLLVLIISLLILFFSLRNQLTEMEHRLTFQSQLYESKLNTANNKLDQVLNEFKQWKEDQQLISHYSEVYTDWNDETQEILINVNFSLKEQESGSKVFLLVNNIGSSNETVERIELQHDGNLDYQQAIWLKLGQKYILEVYIEGNINKQFEIHKIDFSQLENFEERFTLLKLDTYHTSLAIVTAIITNNHFGFEEMKLNKIYLVTKINEVVNEPIDITDKVEIDSLDMYERIEYRNDFRFEKEDHFSAHLIFEDKDGNHIKTEDIVHYDPVD
jgi:hypothetical protein